MPRPSGRRRTGGLTASDLSRSRALQGNLRRAQAQVDDAASARSRCRPSSRARPQLRAFAAGVEPDFVAALGGDFVERRQADRRRQIDADTVEMRRPAPRPTSAIDGQALDLAPLRDSPDRLRSRLAGGRERTCCRTSSDRRRPRMATVGLVMAVDPASRGDLLGLFVARGRRASAVSFAPAYQYFQALTS